MSADLLSGAVSSALRGDPREVAMEFRGEAITWAYVRQVADAVEQELDAAGLGPCAPIAMAPRNRPSFCAALLSLLAGRRSIVMVYAFQSPEALGADLARQCPPAVILDAQDATAAVIAALDPATAVLALDGDLASAEPVRVLREVGGRDRGHLRGATSEPILEMLTSGTTGAPKRYPVTYGVLEKGVVSGSVLGAGDKGGGSVTPGTVNFPISNISGIYSYLAMAAVRRPVVLMEKFNLEEWRAFVRRYRPISVVLPPAGVRMMLDAKAPPEELEGVRYVMAGTSAIDPATHAEFERTYGVSILLSYGATEFCGAATTMTAELHAAFGQAKFGSVGRPCPGNDVRIVDPQTRAPVAPGETGLLEVRIGAIGEDYIQTTDLGVMDQDGFLFIKGRADGVISRGGFKIMPATVEAVLNRYPGVSASVVVGSAPTTAARPSPGRRGGDGAGMPRAEPGRAGGARPRGPAVHPTSRSASW